MGGQEQTKRKTKFTKNICICTLPLQQRQLELILLNIPRVWAERRTKKINSLGWSEWILKVSSHTFGTSSFLDILPGRRFFSSIFWAWPNIFWYMSFSLRASRFDFNMHLPSNWKTKPKLKIWNQKKEVFGSSPVEWLYYLDQVLQLFVEQESQHWFHPWPRESDGIFGWEIIFVDNFHFSINSLFPFEIELWRSPVDTLGNSRV